MGGGEGSWWVVWLIIGLGGGGGEGLQMGFGGGRWILFICLRQGGGGAL